MLSLNKNKSRDKDLLQSKQINQNLFDDDDDDKTVVAF